MATTKLLQRYASMLSSNHSRKGSLNSTGMKRNNHFPQTRNGRNQYHVGAKRRTVSSNSTNATFISRKPVAITAAALAAAGSLVLYSSTSKPWETAATEGVSIATPSDESDKIKGIRRMKGQGNRTNKLCDKAQCTSVSTFCTQGPRPKMEDEMFCSMDGCFFGVYDGHGGPRVSALTKEHLYEYFSDVVFNKDRKSSTDEESPESEPIISRALNAAFERLSAMVLRDYLCEYQGSTAVVVVLNEGEIWSGNVGDSRAVLCRDSKAIDLTEDHKPNSDSEKARVEALGGVVKWFGYRGPDRQPVPGMGAYRINGNMAVSRAIGDKSERPFVSSEAEIKRFERDNENDQFIILASDGLWDVMTSQETVDFVNGILAGSVGALQEGGSATNKSAGGSRPITKRLSQWMKGYSKDTGMLRAVVESRKHKMARYLVEESIRRGTSDNVTVVLVWLR